MLTTVTFNLFLEYIYYMLLAKGTHKAISILEMKVRVVDLKWDKNENRVARGFPMV